MNPTQIIPIPAGINPGLHSAKNTTMLQILGRARDTFDHTCRPATRDPLKSLLVTADVGPFRATGIRPAVELAARRAGTGQAGAPRNPCHSQHRRNVLRPADRRQPEHQQPFLGNRRRYQRRGHTRRGTDAIRPAGRQNARRAGGDGAVLQPGRMVLGRRLQHLRGRDAFRGGGRDDPQMARGGEIGAGDGEPDGDRSQCVGRRPRRRGPSNCRKSCWRWASTSCPMASSER